MVPSETPMSHGRVSGLRRSKEYGGAVVVSTQRLSEEDWEPIPNNRLLSINGGEVQVMSSVI